MLLVLDKFLEDVDIDAVSSKPNDRCNDGKIFSMTAASSPNVSSKNRRWIARWLASTEDDASS